MKIRKLAILAASTLALSLALPPALFAEEGNFDVAKVAMGRTTFRSLCTSCHGLEGKGDGPVAKHLSPTPTDLTKIAAANQGTSPAERVHAAIDGRDPVSGHGTKDMPVWGTALMQLDNVQSEEDVQKKIAELTEFVRSIQK